MKFKQNQERGTHGSYVEWESQYYGNTTDGGSVDNNTDFFDDTQNYETYAEEYESGRKSQKFDRDNDNLYSPPKFATLENSQKSPVSSKIQDLSHVNNKTFNPKTINSNFYQSKESNMSA